ARGRRTPSAGAARPPPSPRRRAASDRVRRRLVSRPDVRPVAVAVLNDDLTGPGRTEQLGDLVRDRHGAMAATGAAERDPEAGLLLLFVAWQRELQERHKASEEHPGRRVSEDERPDRLVAPGQRTEGFDVERVLHEAHVEDEVGARRQAVLVAEADELHEHPRRPLAVPRAQRVTKV